MVIVAGQITVDPEQLESYLAGSVGVVEKARRAALGVAGGRRDVPQKRPRNKQGAAMLSASVAEYDIADVRHLFDR